MIELDLGTTLLFTGIYNILSGFLFQIPIPVQPMKTIAAVALAEDSGLNVPCVMAAGIFVSACVLFLGVTGLMGLASRLIPLPVIRGMQLGVGVGLAAKGFRYIWYDDPSAGVMRSMWGVNGLFLGMLALAFILVTVYSLENHSVSNSDLTLRRGNEQSECGPFSAPQREERISEQGEQIYLEEGGRGCIDSVSDCQSRSTVKEENGCTHGHAGSVIHSEMESEQVSPRGSFSCESMHQSVVNRNIEWLLKPLFILGNKATEACDGGKTTLSSTAMCQSLPASARVPAALIIVLVGIICTIASNPSVLRTLSIGPSKPLTIVPSSAEWRRGILNAGLPQLPLTILNSVISVCQLSNQLFPTRPARPSKVASSVGLMNLLGCWFGAMPSCHGAGGLAAQVRFGARWGTAPVLLGSFKILLALLFGSSLFDLLQSFPTVLLGAMLIFSGIELASVAKGQVGQRGVTIMLLTASIAIAIGNVAIGVAIGLVCAYIFAASDFLSTQVYPWCRDRLVSSNEAVADR